jgi:hypothetical protein
MTAICDSMPQMASRKQPPEPPHNRLWKAGYAWSAFQNVVDTCAYILTENIQPEAKIYYPLCVAITVLYSRPFKRSKGIEKLTVQVVPKKFLRLHRQLILVRDQTSAHSDASKDAALFQGRPANSVQLFVRNHGRRVAPGMNQLKFKTTAISEIRDLASTLSNRMLEHIRKVASQYPNDIPDGDYEIDLATGIFRRQ